METLVTIHDLFRWLVLLAAVVGIGGSAAVWFGQAPWRLGDRLGLIYTIALDIEVALGIIVWILAIFTPTGQVVALQVIHPLVMLVAVGVAHMTRIRAERAPSDRARGQFATLGFLASLILILLAIPGLLLPAG